MGATIGESSEKLTMMSSSPLDLLSLRQNGSKPMVKQIVLYQKLLPESNLHLKGAGLFPEEEDTHKMF